MLSLLGAKVWSCLMIAPTQDDFFFLRTCWFRKFFVWTWRAQACIGMHLLWNCQCAFWLSRSRSWVNDSFLNMFIYYICPLFSSKLLTCRKFIYHFRESKLFFLSLKKFWHFRKFFKIYQLNDAIFIFLKILNYLIKLS